ncbi:Tumor necrosis factor receptorsuperfamily member 1A [Biomphalaria pfeifferi]|uniref:Tumor necrosis factor receptorsuperfamily member 1A n=1 Tax=Biomphalaria pfeifferi TaxID=112525 RepID=A0AAD8C2L1_BIOPF|nr:Tumor necrosis factor receptorsuperfamily member 1A [Biomphalaria pfeifferi]
MWTFVKKYIVWLCLLLLAIVAIIVILICNTPSSVDQVDLDVSTRKYTTNINPTESTVKVDLYCNAGEYIEMTVTGPVCTPCPPGTFNPDNNHTYISCFPCTEPNIYEKEVELKACTLTSDTELGCLKGYFRKEMGLHEASCDRCSKCKGPKYSILHRCTRFNDTQCRLSSFRAK